METKIWFLPICQIFRLLSIYSTCFSLSGMTNTVAKRSYIEQSCYGKFWLNLHEHVCTQKIWRNIMFFWSKLSKNHAISSWKEGSKACFQLQTFFFVGKICKSCSAKPPQLAFVESRTRSALSTHTRKIKASAFLSSETAVHPTAYQNDARSQT